MAERNSETARAKLLRDLANEAFAIYEVVGNSGATYIFFWFKDQSHSVCALKRQHDPTAGVAARWEATVTKKALVDCGIEAEGTTYQMGRELLKRLTAT